MKEIKKILTLDENIGWEYYTPKSKNLLRNQLCIVVIWECISKR